jgi:ATP-dependent Zn protease
MVKDWGMSEKVGLRTHDGNNSGPVVVNDLSPSTSDLIDSEIKRILTVSLSLLTNVILWPKFILTVSL